MDVLEAIRTRRTIFQFKPDPVPMEVLEKICGYGIWAPNHHLTNPWRFTVLGEEMKEKLGRRYAEIQREKCADGVGEEIRKKAGEGGYNKFMSKPTIVAVSCLQEGDEQQKREDYAATCCAMMNVQLAAWNEGVGMQWSTGPITMEEETYRLLGVDPEREYIIGFFYTGYPETVLNKERKPLSDVLRWTA